VSFFNLYRHHFARVAVAVPEVRVADPAFNAAETIRLARQAGDRHAALVVFPELGLSAYSCEDLFHQQALLDASLDALAHVVAASRNLAPVVVVGLPLRVDGPLLNCAAVVHRGRILGLVPKTYLPNYREFYELRQFSPGDFAVRDHVSLLGQDDVPLGANLLFQPEDWPLFTLAVEICEDLWTPVPPSSYAAMAGATVLANLSASNVTVGKEEYRRQLVANQFGESTTDLAWDGHGMVYENGTRLAESERFADTSQLVFADVDLDRIAQDRMRQTTFSQSVQRHRESATAHRTVRFRLAPPLDAALPLERTYERFPYVPSDPASRDARLRDILAIQSQGLVKRLRAMKAERVVIGVSGGLDSTLALLVCARAVDAMHLPRANILAYTMPGFATSERTLGQAKRLMEAVGCTAREIDIRPSCVQMLEDIGHPFVDGRPTYDVTFENVQAGERTSHLFRLANLHNAPVVGTSDLSELALGWSTYGVGDQMAHYHVNASVPKTLVKFLVRHVADTRELGPAASMVLLDVLATEISPELVPGDAGAGGQPAQSTESVVGPYELQDFHLYYTLRFGYAPPKVAFLAWSAWHDAARGAWPGTPAAERRGYGIGEIKKWLRVFLFRFFQISQYKRSAMPNAPKVGSGGSLSPRSDWRAPSDGESAAWLAQLDEIPDA
jgi:NAD+ synthase (glutamine-hydrolysing)